MRGTGVRRIFGSFLFEPVVDLLRAEVVKTGVIQGILRQRHAGVEHQGIDGVVGSLVPSLPVAVAAPGVMLEGGVHDFVGKYPHQLVGRQLIHKGRVVEEALTVGRHGWDDGGGDRCKPEDQRSEEGMIEQEDGSGFPDSVDCGRFHNCHWRSSVFAVARDLGRGNGERELVQAGTPM